MAMSKRTGMARTFAVSSQKGGVGKTTTAANLAAVWSETGVRVLAVDFDPQFALTRSLGWAPSDAPATAVDVIAGHSELGAAAVNVRAGLDLLCGHRDLARLELTLVAQTKCEDSSRAPEGQPLRLRRDHRRLPATLGCHRDAMFAAREVLVPVSMLDAARTRARGATSDDRPLARARRRRSRHRGRADARRPPARQLPVIDTALTNSGFRS